MGDKRAVCLNCIDGRVQIPVIEWIKRECKVDHVDMITEPGPARVLAEQESAGQVESILKRIDISVEKHDSKGIAVVSHHDCAGNPADEQEKHNHLAQAVRFLRERYPGVTVLALYVDHRWDVKELSF